MKIIVSENQFKKIMVSEGLSSDVLIEQVAVTNDQNALTIVQQKINQLVSDPKKEKMLLDGINVILHLTNTGFILQIGQKKFPMNQVVRGVHTVMMPPGGEISASAIPLSSFAAEIEKIAEYKALIEKHPEIKAQIAAGKATSKLYSDKDQQGFFKLTVYRELQDKKQRKLAIDMGTPYPLGEFMETNKVIYRLPNNMYGELESGYIIGDIVGPVLAIKPPEQKPGQLPQDQVRIQPMGLADVFEFGTVDFKDPGRTNQRIQQFVQQFKENIERFGTPFIEHIQSQNPTIYGYASIDGDPNQKIVGEYQPCSASGTRAEYDTCLSNERAKVIADILNKSLPELNGVFTGKGVGPTTKWGPGWTPENPTVPEQTAPNRRYLLSKIAPFVGQPQQMAKAQ